MVSPVFDTQIAAGCIGLKPQIGYADLVKTLLDVTLAKGQTRTDWSKRPLTRGAARVRGGRCAYLNEIAARLARAAARARPRAVGARGLRALEDPQLYEPDPAHAWQRLRGLAQAAAGGPRARQALAVWREKTARASAICRAAGSSTTQALFKTADAIPATPAALAALSRPGGR